MKTIATIMLLATSCMAVAGEGGGHKPPPDPSVTVKQNVKIDSHNVNTHVNTNTATSNANSKSNSKSNSESNSNSASSSTAEGGDSAAQGGSAAVVTNYPQQAPSVAQGSFAIQGCGVAGNLGGSNTHGSGFLGFGFTPDECYRLMLAQAYQAIGQTEAACEVLNRTDMALNLETKRGLPLPKCHKEPAPVIVEPAPDAVTHAELQQHEERIVTTLAQK